MIFYDKERIKEINCWKDNDFYLLIDFDKTLTAGNSWGSWEIILNNKNVPEEYKREVYELFNYYRPIEISESIDRKLKEKHMIDWWNEEVKLFIKYQFDEKFINESLNNVDVIKFRDGAKKLLKVLYSRKIPVIIISAGIGDFIKKFLLHNNCYFNNIYIISNFLKFENGKLIGFGENIIHSLNKDIAHIPNNVVDLIRCRNKVILLGDSIADINMAKNIESHNLYTIGFLEEKIEYNLKYFKNSFDLVATNNTSFDDVAEKLKILKRKIY